MSPLIMAAVDAPLNWGWVLGAILVWAVTTGATWLVASRITSAVLQRQIESLLESFAAIVADQRALAEKISQIKDTHAHFELVAAKTYSTRDDYAHLAVELSSIRSQITEKFSTLSEQVRASVGKVHARVDEISEKVIRLEERTGIHAAG